MIELVFLCSNIDICTRLFRRRTSVCIRAWPTGPPTSSSRASTCSRSRRSRIPFKSVSHHLALALFLCHSVVWLWLGQLAIS